MAAPVAGYVGTWPATLYLRRSQHKCAYMYLLWRMQRTFLLKHTSQARIGGIIATEWNEQRHQMSSWSQPVSYVEDERRVLGLDN